MRGAGLGRAAAGCSAGSSARAAAAAAVEELGTRPSLGPGGGMGRRQGAWLSGTAGAELGVQLAPFVQNAVGVGVLVLVRRVVCSSGAPTMCPAPHEGQGTQQARGQKSLPAWG